MDHTALTQFSVSIGPDGISGIIGIPPSPAGVVIFAHGSGSGRLSPRNNHVALGLRKAGFATLLLDLLASYEEQDRAKVFDIGLLARRLLQSTEWAATVSELARLPIGYFGASTGAGAALLAAAATPERVRAVVSRGGRPDLAGEAILARVRAPTLLIVGSLDDPVIALNRQAMRHLRCTSDLVIIPGASHLFEEPGTLDEVIDHAQIWFRTYLPEEATE